MVTDWRTMPSAAGHGLSSSSMACRISRCLLEKISRTVYRARVFVQHFLNHGLDDLAVQVLGQIPGHRRDLLRVERVARRDVDAQ
jgi:hypothetical protein